MSPTRSRDGKRTPSLRNILTISLAEPRRENVSKKLAIVPDSCVGVQRDTASLSYAKPVGNRWWRRQSPTLYYDGWPLTEAESSPAAFSQGLASFTAKGRDALFVFHFVEIFKSD